MNIKKNEPRDTKKHQNHTEGKNKRVGRKVRKEKQNHERHSTSAAKIIQARLMEIGK